jgi:NADPH:quinone reductase-like Zn-dependent oxidoreductase
MLAGNYRWYDELRLPLVPGYDVAGVVEGGDWEPGAAVIASTGHSRTQVGGFAEYVTLPAAQVAAAPANLDWTEAATLPLAGLTAHQALDLLDLTPGSTLLINGPRGAVGRFATELAVARGITVLTPDRAKNSARGSARESAEGSARESAQGSASGAAAGSAGGAAQGSARESAQGSASGAAPGSAGEPASRSVDAALDVVGGARARAAFAAVRDGGSYVTTVPEFWVPGGQFTADRGIEPRIVRAEPDGRTLDRLARAAEAGQLTATVAKTLALTDAADALDLLQAGGVRGKLVLVP